MKYIFSCGIFIFLNILFINMSFAYGLANAEIKSEAARALTLQNAEKITLLDIEGYQQTKDYTCGPAAVMSILHYYGYLSDKEMNPQTEDKIAKEMGSTVKYGTNPKQIINWFLKHNFEVKYGENGNIGLLQSSINKSIPVLVEWIDWGGHWVIAAGYYGSATHKEEKTDTLIFADPAAHFFSDHHYRGFSKFNSDRFLSMWFDAQFFKKGKLVKGIYIIPKPKTKHAQ